MKFLILATVASAYRLRDIAENVNSASAATGNVYEADNDAMGVTITGPYHTQYIHEPNSDYYDTFVQTSDPLLHPDTGLAITTTGYHWYGQEPLALNKVEGVRLVANPNIY